jgi:hypothetical protein
MDRPLELSGQVREYVEDSDPGLSVVFFAIAQLSGGQDTFYNGYSGANPVWSDEVPKFNTQPDRVLDYYFAPAIGDAAYGNAATTMTLDRNGKQTYSIGAETFTTMDYFGAFTHFHSQGVRQIECFPHHALDYMVHIKASDSSKSTTGNYRRMVAVRSSEQKKKIIPLTEDEYTVMTVQVIDKDFDYLNDQHTLNASDKEVFLHSLEPVRIFMDVYNWLDKGFRPDYAAAMGIASGVGAVATMNALEKVFGQDPMIKGAAQALGIPLATVVPAMVGGVGIALVEGWIRAQDVGKVKGKIISTLTSAGGLGTIGTLAGASALTQVLPEKWMKMFSTGLAGGAAGILMTHSLLTALNEVPLSVRPL